MRLVVGIGGNALLRRGEPAVIQVERRNVATAVKGLARATAGHQLIITHGNGPQVGLLAVESEAYQALDPEPLDVLDAETEGMIGYLLAQELGNEMPDREVMAMLTQVEVDADDPALSVPSKPIGLIHSEASARRLARDHRWTLVRDRRGFRRLVPSPTPLAVVELATIARLAADGVVVICAGGGGIPVIRDAGGRIAGIEAVIDKDSTTGLLAAAANADRLVFLTDVPAVWSDWDDPLSAAIRQAPPQHMRQLKLAPGSMGAKVDAACRFVEETGRPAVIGELDDAERIVAGKGGTTITAEPGPTLIYRPQEVAAWLGGDTAALVRSTP